MSQERMGGEGGEIEWSGKASLRKWHLRRELKEGKEGAIRVSVKQHMQRRWSWTMTGVWENSWEAGVAGAE